MDKIKFEDKDLPGLFHISDEASIEHQTKHFVVILVYLVFVFVAALFSFIAAGKANPFFNIVSTILFLVTIFLLAWLRIKKPSDIWYNGRAVAESVKTRSWRWMMRAEPYDNKDSESSKSLFLIDLKTILLQNESLIGKIGINESIKDPISTKMEEIRRLGLDDRIKIYRNQRIQEQAAWYIKKTIKNKKDGEIWFWVTISLHLLAFLFLLFSIAKPSLRFPIEIIAVAATSVLTWTQANKYDELSSSYALTAHEINFLKSELHAEISEAEFSEYVINCENAFSREHTQWFARKNH